MGTIILTKFNILNQQQLNKLKDIQANNESVYNCKLFYINTRVKVVRRAEGKIDLPGRGGAPKFSKNWLPFACSAYDPDHIFVPEGAREFPRASALSGTAFNTTLTTAWDQLY